MVIITGFKNSKLTLPLHLLHSLPPLSPFPIFLSPPLSLSLSPHLFLSLFLSPSLHSWSTSQFYTSQHFSYSPFPSLLSIFFSLLSFISLFFSRFLHSFSLFRSSALSLSSYSLSFSLSLSHPVLLSYSPSMFLPLSPPHSPLTLSPFLLSLPFYTSFFSSSYSHSLSLSSISLLSSFSSLSVCSHSLLLFASHSDLMLPLQCLLLSTSGVLFPLERYPSK
ncbi:unnamed protein product [Acanthosepion pharaonis]|uniref:Uncharacterized protein n=1 Tax=Acanthosepion pharaonis TaxID=158019 RepID=A0A812CAX4_ACAPH|nr:unnamed protein product [Sepia pharaonis]